MDYSLVLHLQAGTERRKGRVLILVVMDYSLVPNTFYIMLTGFVVLILVVMDYSLVHNFLKTKLGLSLS